MSLDVVGRHASIQSIIHFFSTQQGGDPEKKRIKWISIFRKNLNQTRKIEMDHFDNGWRHAIWPAMILDDSHLTDSNLG